MNANIRRLSAVARRGGATRREFLGLALAAGLALPGTGSALAVGPKRGGVFRAGLASGSTTDSLDPATWSNNFMADLGMGVYADTLFEIDPDFNAVPNLVESYDHDGTARVWSLKLKKGVAFHDGRKLTSADVLASIRHHVGEKAKSPMKPVLALIEEMRADGEHGVVFELKYPYADFPYLLTDYHLPILPARDDGRLDWQAVMETLAQHEVNEVLLECGATLAGSALQAGVVDELIVYMAPHLMGDAARGLVSLPGVERLDQRIPLSLRDVRVLGSDLRLSYQILN